jgi:hypothetical protein
MMIRIRHNQFKIGDGNSDIRKICKNQIKKIHVIGGEIALHKSKKTRVGLNNTTSNFGVIMVINLGQTINRIVTTVIKPSQENYT